MNTRDHRVLCSFRMPLYFPRMAHYLLNFSEGDRERAAALLDVKMWGIGGGERHRDELAPGDVALIYVGPWESSSVAPSSGSVRLGSTWVSLGWLSWRYSSSVAQCCSETTTQAASRGPGSSTT
jgi:hypothetical protein